MGKRLMLFGSLFFAVVLHAQNQNELTFQEVEHKSYQLYTQKEWKELVRFSGLALDNSIDYYYLRLRMGDAYLSLNKQVLALNQYKQAGKMNSGDRYLHRQLILSLQFLGQNREARAYSEKFPADPNRKNKRIEIESVLLNTGVLLSDNSEKIGPLYYGGFGASWGIFSRMFFYQSYTFLKQERYELSFSTNSGGDALVTYNYPSSQHQVLNRAEWVSSQLWKMAAGWNWVWTEIAGVSSRSHVVAASITCPKGIFRFSPHGGWGNLNGRNQFQGGLRTLVFPFGGNRFYSLAKGFCHFDDGNFQPGGGLLAGIGITPEIYAELGGTFGSVTNFFDEDGMIVISRLDQTKFQVSAGFAFFIKNKWEIRPLYQLQSLQQTFGQEQTYFYHLLNLTIQWKKQLPLSASF